MKQINLLPEHLKEAERIRIIRNSSVLTLVSALVILSVVHVLINCRLNFLRRIANRPQILVETPETGMIRQEIESTTNEMRGYLDSHEDMISLVDSYYITSDILKKISEIAFDKVWLRDFAIDIQAKNCQIKGNAFNTRLVSEFMLELKKILLFEDVELITMGKGDELKNENIDFKITCRLK